MWTGARILRMEQLLITLLTTILTIVGTGAAIYYWGIRPLRERVERMAERMMDGFADLRERVARLESH